MTNSNLKNFTQKSLFANNLLAAFLILLYVSVYGISSQAILTGANLTFFICSLFYTLGVMYVRDPDVQKAKAKKGMVYSQLIGTVLVATYLLLFGISSVVLFNGLQLIFFMTSYVFALSYFYLRDPKRLQKVEEEISYSVTKQEKYPCIISKDDMSWFVRETNDPLASIIGFTELLLSKDFTESEKEYILRNIYQSAFQISHNVNKVAKTIEDSQTKPRELYKVIDLLADKNFK